MKPIRLAIFASGAGTNAGRIIDAFQYHPGIEIAGVFTNKKNAGVMDVARAAGISTLIFDRDSLYHTSLVPDQLREMGVTHIILAGFLWKVPDPLLHAFEGRILNIHPALLPKFGGKGMYGMHVHEAVKNAGEKQTGITIHEVNEHYDEGRIVAQYAVSLNGSESAEEIAAKVQELEHRYFAAEIEKWVKAPGHH